MPPEDAVTLGEVYRLVQSIDEKVELIRAEQQRDSHSLRNRIGAHDVAIALVQKDVSAVQADLTTVKAERREHAGWAISAAIAVGGGLVASLGDFLFGWWRR